MTYKISLSAVRVPEEVYPMMEETLHSGWIAQGKLVEEFENNIADFVGAKHCIAVSNGTMADAVAVAAMRERYSIKRVVVPALTFIAQPNSVRYNNLEVVFEDVTNDWQMDFGQRCYAKDTLLFPADLMGRTFNPPPVSCGGLIVEDACEAFGTVDDAGYAGTLGEMGTYSFFPSHTISTGEGGAIVTDDDDLDYLCRSLRAHGFSDSDPMHKFEFPRIGFNARMTNMQAALGIALMKHIEDYLFSRRFVFKKMREGLGGFDDRPSDLAVIPHGYPVEFVSSEARDDAMRKLLEAGIECRKFFSCIPEDELPYQGMGGDFPNARRISHTHLYLPCHQNMTMDDVYYILGVMDKIGGRA